METSKTTTVEQTGTSVGFLHLHPAQSQVTLAKTKTAGCGVRLGMLAISDISVIAPTCKDKKTQEFWKATFLRAAKLQREQRTAWNTFRQGLKLDDGDEDQGCRYAQGTFTEFRAAYQTFTSRKDSMGFVETLPLRKPELQDNRQWDVIFKDRRLHRTYAQQFSWAYAIQLYRNIWLSIPSDADENLDNVMLDELEKINKSFEGILKRLPETYRETHKELGYIRIPTLLNQRDYPTFDDEFKKKDEDNEADWDEEDLEEDFFEKFATEQVVHDPEAVQEILEELGGSEGTEGILETLLRESAKGKTTSGYKKSLEKFNEVLVRADAAAGDLKSGLQLEELENFMAQHGDVFQLIEDMKQNPQDPKLQSRYQNARETAELFVAQRELPQKLVDSIVPPLKWLQATTSGPMLSQLLETIGGQKGALHNYLWSLAGGNPNEKSKNIIENANRHLAKDGNNMAPYSPIEGELLERLVADVKAFMDLESTCRMNVNDNFAQDKIIRLQADLLKTWMDYPGERENKDVEMDMDMDGGSQELTRFKPTSSALTTRKRNVVPKPAHIQEVDEDFDPYEGEVIEEIEDEDTEPILPYGRRLLQDSSKDDGQTPQITVQKKTNNSPKAPIRQKRLAPTPATSRKPTQQQPPELMSIDDNEEDDTIEVVPAPPAEFDLSLFVETSARPGVVLGQVDGIDAEKTILSYRHVGHRSSDCEDYLRSMVSHEGGKRRRGWGLGHQLLLKYHHPGRKHPSFEFVAASTYKSALTDFIRTGGTEFKASTWEDLNGATWRDCTIGGVLPVKRDENDGYSNAAVTYMLIRVNKLTPKWFTMSTLKKEFGDQVIYEKERHMRKTGQLCSKEPIPRPLRQELMRMEQHKRAMMGQQMPLKGTSEMGKLRKNVVRSADAMQRLQQEGYLPNSAAAGPWGMPGFMAMGAPMGMGGPPWATATWGNGKPRKGKNSGGHPGGWGTQGPWGMQTPGNWGMGPSPPWGMQSEAAWGGPGPNSPWNMPPSRQRGNMKGSRQKTAPNPQNWNAIYSSLYPPKPSTRDKKKPNGYSGPWEASQENAEGPSEDLGDGDSVLEEGEEEEGEEEECSSEFEDFIDDTEYPPPTCFDPKLCNQSQNAYIRGQQPQAYSPWQYNGSY
ncbi:uncharacterized protein LY89DRAFT_784930 [Mollisia scopiformis]|uniref:Uncharacterized protein n=1 Tax=Mollisia scopiformis TaxID=149040 RepID=A0A194WZN1_MOLSC|nr:uncharacterized protein LY89DRAFT_784930 [Mollisia scopiformis]KUJ13169.1 hypothetical protein LY89DRAFT_784930 [Mollisia scopiformis]